MGALISVVSSILGINFLYNVEVYYLVGAAYGVVSTDWFWHLLNNI